MRQINQCLNQQLSTILSQALKLEAYEQHLLVFLPEALKSCCKLAGFKQGRLVIGIDNPALASELRFFLPELRDKLRSEAGFYQLSGIDIKVLSEPLAIKLNPVRKRPPLSDNARQEILKASQETQHEPLKRAWERLYLTRS